MPTFRALFVSHLLAIGRQTRSRVVAFVPQSSESLVINPVIGCAPGTDRWDIKQCDGEIFLMSPDFLAPDETLTAKGLSARAAVADRPWKDGNILGSKLETRDLQSLGILLCGLSATVVMVGLVLTFVLLV